MSHTCQDATSSFSLPPPPPPPPLSLTLFFSSLGKPAGSWGGGHWGDAGEKEAADNMAATPTTREDAPMATMIGTALGSGGGATAPHSLATCQAVRTSARRQDLRVAAASARRSHRDVQGDLQVLQGGMHTQSRHMPPFLLPAKCSRPLCRRRRFSLTARAPPRRFPHRCRGPRIPQVWVQAVQEHDGDDEDIGGYSRGDDDREDAAATTREKGGDGSYDA